jgi:branched-chain amino acid aminotransferase
MAASRIFVNVKGTISRAEDAAVSALDHGFLYGDSVYETVRTYNRKPFLLAAHLDRLQRSLDRVFLSLPLSRRELEAEILRTIEEVSIDDDVGVRIVVSRGQGPIGLDVTRCVDPGYLIYVFELPDDVRAAEAAANSSGQGSQTPATGVSVVVSKIRRNSPRALDPGIKSGNFLNNILAYKDAHDAGAHEAILCNAEGYLAEGTTSNIFVVKNEFVWTPCSYGILDGITRRVVFEEAKKFGIPLGETNIPPEALFSADEVFITSSVKGIVPVTKANGSQVGDGQPGAVTRRLQALYQQRTEQECGKPDEASARPGRQPA